MSSKPKWPDAQGKGNGKGKGKGKGNGKRSNAKKPLQAVLKVGIRIMFGMMLSLNMVKRNGFLEPMPTTDSANANKPKKKYRLKQCQLKKGEWKRVPYRDTLRTLLKFPGCVENTESAAKLLLLVLLSQVFPLLVESLISIPILLLKVTPLIASSVIGPLLRAIQGPEEWRGKGWRLSRPWIIGSVRSLGETEPFPKKRTEKTEKKQSE